MQAEGAAALSVNIEPFSNKSDFKSVDLVDEFPLVVNIDAHATHLDGFTPL